jgi:two-component system response regulator HydG
VFHQVVLSALDDSLASSDLFGHVAGAYTDARQSRPGHFVSASHGTLFLDEIGKASAAVQRKLLHAVEQHEVWPVGADRALRVNVRLVAATSVPLDELVERDLFLPDLAARMRSFRIRMPPLRERREDIPDLARQFVAANAGRFGYRDALPRISAGLLDVLQRADWPYNLRQLDAAVQRILVHAQGEDTLRPEHHAEPAGQAAHQLYGTPSRRRATAGATRRLMDDLGCATDVARVLGVSRTTVYRHLRQITPASTLVDDV